MIFTSKKGRQTILKFILQQELPVFIYESVHRIEKTLYQLKDLWFDGKIFLARELTKMYEQKQCDHVDKIIEDISSLRPTEPMLRNMLHHIYINLNYDNSINMIKSFNDVEKKLKKIIKDGEKKLLKYGSNKIFKDSVIYTHCHSSTVTKIIINSKNEAGKIIDGLSGIASILRY